MMRVEVDAAVRTGGSREWGRLSGSLEVSVLPRTGEVVSLLVPDDPVLDGATVVQLRVEAVVHRPVPNSAVLLLLQDVVVETDAIAGEVVQRLASGYGLRVARAAAAMV